MKRIFMILTLAFFIIHCGGYDPNKPVYNTAANPDNFPPSAISLLDNIENGSLVGFDTIIGTFAELYTQHGELLDNKAWSEIIKNLGLRFQVFADTLLKQGIDKYYRAAEWYGLAGFARPDDVNIKNKNAVLGVWKKEVDDTTLAADFNIPGKQHTFSEQLDLLRHFLYNDSLYREFGRQYLFMALLGEYSDSTPIPSAVMDSLSLPDKAFLTYLGLNKKPLEKKFINFTEPEIDLVTAQIRPLGNDWFRIELYLMPKEPVAVDFTVALRGNIAGEVPNLGNQGRNIIPFDFKPENPSTQWVKDKIEVAYHKFYYPGVKGRFSVGLYEKGTNPLKYNRVAISNFNFYTLPDTVLKVY